MIEELIRKIEHYKEYQELKQQNRLFNDYTQNLLKDISIDFKVEKMTLPIVILTNYSKLVDKIVFAYMDINNRVLDYIPLTDNNWKEKIKSRQSCSLLYISDLQVLKKITHLGVILQKVYPYWWMK